MFSTEGTPDKGLDEPDPIPGNTQPIGDVPLVPEGGLRRVPYSHPPLLIRSHAALRLHVALMGRGRRESPLGHYRRFLPTLRHIPPVYMVLIGNVVGKLIMYEGGVGIDRLLRVKDSGQRLVIHPSYLPTF